MVSGGDRCPNCGATLAVDQRYCVECGLRRGKPRFAIASGGTPEPAAEPAVRPAGGWSRLSAILAVIALLLAIGVGVLIGNATRSSIKQPVKVVVTGGALSTSGGSSSSASSAGKTTAQGGSGSSPSSTCTKATAGCQNGKQTGNFFGG